MCGGGRRHGAIVVGITYAGQEIDEWKWQFIVRVRSNIGMEISENEWLKLSQFGLHIG
jgi:hypothetical protein